jgi:hypothetical protein
MIRQKTASPYVHVARTTRAARNHPSTAVTLTSLDKSPQRRHELQRQAWKKDISLSVDMAKGSLTYNLHLAERASAHARSLLTTGSNAVPDAVPGLSAQASKMRIVAQRDMDRSTLAGAASLGKIGYVVDPQDSDWIWVKISDVSRVHAASLKASGFGYCGELASAAWCYLADNCPANYPLEFYKVDGTTHRLVIIGSAPNQVVCDPWANKTYPLSDLATMQLPENDVKCVDDPDGTGHYLAGNLVPEQPLIGIQRYY